MTWRFGSAGNPYFRCLSIECGPSLRAKDGAVADFCTRRPLALGKGHGGVRSQALDRQRQAGRLPPLQKDSHML
jgi:hypothetical protein